jgi:uncharacterized protein (UPF0333 family)
MYLVLDSIFDPSPSGEGIDAFIKDANLNNTILDFEPQGDAFGGQVDLAQLDVVGDIAANNQVITRYALNGDNWEVQIQSDTRKSLDLSKLTQDATEIFNGVPYTDEVFAGGSTRNIRANLVNPWQNDLNNNRAGANAILRNFHYSSSFPNYRVYNDLTGAINSAWAQNPSLYGRNLSFPYSFGRGGDEIDISGTNGPGLRNFDMNQYNPYGDNTQKQDANVDPEILFNNDDTTSTFSSYDSGNMRFFFIQTEMAYGTGLYFANAKDEVGNPNNIFEYFDYYDLEAGDFVSMFGYVGTPSFNANERGVLPLFEYNNNFTHKINLNIVTDPPQSELAEKGWFISARAELVTEAAINYDPQANSIPPPDQRMRSIFAQDDEGVTWRINIGALPIRHGGDNDTDLYTVNQGTITDNPIKLYISGAIPLE